MRINCHQNENNDLSQWKWRNSIFAQWNNCEPILVHWAQSDIDKFSINIGIIIRKHWRLAYFCIEKWSQLSFKVTSLNAKKQNLSYLVKETVQMNVSDLVLWCDPDLLLVEAHTHAPPQEAPQSPQVVNTVAVGVSEVHVLWPGQSGRAVAGHWATETDAKIQSPSLQQWQVKRLRKKLN